MSTVKIGSYRAHEHEGILLIGAGWSGETFNLTLNVRPERQDKRVAVTLDIEESARLLARLEAYASRCPALRDKLVEARERVAQRGVPRRHLPA